MPKPVIAEQLKKIFLDPLYKNQLDLALKWGKNGLKAESESLLESAKRCYIIAINHLKIGIENIDEQKIRHELLKNIKGWENRIEYLTDMLKKVVNKRNNEKQSGGTKNILIKRKSKKKKMRKSKKKNLIKK